MNKFISKYYVKYIANIGSENVSKSIFFLDVTWIIIGVLIYALIGTHDAKAYIIGALAGYLISPLIWTFFPKFLKSESKRILYAGYFPLPCFVMWLLSKFGL